MLHGMRCKMWLGLSIAMCLGPSMAHADDAAGAPSYSKQVLPILRANCFGCHQDAKKLGGYRMTDFASLLAGGESEAAAIVPGKATESSLIHSITPVDGKAEMPKNGKPLSAVEIETIQRWIDAGAIDDSPPAGPRYTSENPPTYTRPPTISSVDFSNDGRWLALSGFHETIVIDSQTWKPAHRLVGMSPRVESVRFSPDGHWLAVAAGEQGVSGELQIWNCETWQLERSLQIGNDTLYGVAWSPDSSSISFGMTDNTIRAVNLQGEQRLYQRAHEDWPRATVFTVDGKHLISASRDMTVKLTEVETERFIDNITSITPGALRGGVQALARHPLRNEVLFGGADGTPKIYRVFRQTARVIGDDANLIRQLEPMPGRIFDVDISQDGKYLAAVSTIDNQSTIKVWDYDVDGQVPEEIKSIQNKQVASRTAEENKKLDQYVTAQPKVVATWTIPNSAAYAIAFDGTGKLAVGSSDGRVRAWNIADGSPVCDFNVIESFAVSSDQEQNSTIASLRSHRLQEISLAHSKERETPEAIEERNQFPISNVTSIEVQPGSIELNAWNDSVQILVTATLDNGYVRDVTRMATMSSPSDIVWLSKRGWLQPIQSGTTSVEVQLGSFKQSIPVTVNLRDDHAMDFVRDVNPVLSRLGCNQGTCHGAQAGKNGFKLSLRGYDPVFDVRALADDLAGRRINPASPTNSLMMTKPLGLVPHVGGKLMGPGDAHALVLRQWIAEGSKLDTSRPRVAKIEVTPKNPVVSMPGAIQQVRVTATYTDGSTRDVTREAFVETGNAEVASVIEGARVQAIRRGEAPILARYEGAYSAMTLTVMGDRSEFAWQPEQEPHPIDQFVAKKWERMKIEPSQLCSDTDFLRRVMLDLVGLPPTAEQVRAFVADPTSSEEKRNRIIDELLASEGFVDHWTNKWSDLLQVNSKFLGKEGATKFRDWIRSSIASNKPYDKFVYEVVTATGSNRENPAASYYKILRTPEDTVENTTHLFLGVRFNCNKCHDHPFERWTQDQYYQVAAYFTQVALKKDEASGNQTIGGTAVEGAKPLYEEVSDTGNQEIKHPKTQQSVAPKFPFEAEHAIVENSSRRQEFGAWLTSSKNPYFARSFVNRMWGYLLGKGLIEPIDDIRAGNPASIPELLDYLERDFIEHQFDVRQTIRNICRSKTYQRSIETNRWNADDDRNYSHAMPRRLPAEVLYDSIHQVTGSTSKLPGMNPGARAATLADADAGLPDGFLNNLGRPPRESACECERSSDLRLGSVMALVSGPTLGAAIADQSNSIRQLAAQHASDSELIDELFLRVLNRPAQPAEVEAAQTVFANIESDHAALLQLLEEREAWWTPEKAQKQAKLDAEKAETQAKMEARIQSIQPARDAAEQARQARLEAAKAAIGDFESKVADKLSEFVEQRKNNTLWQTVMPIRASSSNNDLLVPQSDRSIIARGGAEKTIYTIDTQVAGEFNVARLEALTAPEFKAVGPGISDNGNFVITEIELFVGLPDKPQEMRKLKLAKGFTDYDQPGFSAVAVIDDNLNDQGGWAVFGAQGVEHWAVFELQAPVRLQPGEVLQWRIHQFHDAAKHRLGRFRLSLAQQEGEASLGLPESLSVLSRIPRAIWDDKITQEPINYFKVTSTELRNLQFNLNRENQPLPEDGEVVALRQRIERLSAPISDDPKLVRLREDVKESENQRQQARVTAAEDITWALINSPAFLFNH